MPHYACSFTILAVTGWKFVLSYLLLTPFQLWQGETRGNFPLLSVQFLLNNQVFPVALHSSSITSYLTDNKDTLAFYYHDQHKQGV